MDDFAKDLNEKWREASEADKENREEAMWDLEFAAGQQWDSAIREYRESGDRPFPLPCLTINTLPQFIGQVVGDRQSNKTSIKILPKEDGDKDVAETRTELIRSIEHHSKAQRSYTMAFEQAVTCGQGNFRVDLDYAYEDVFERDLFVRGIPNPMAVMWDAQSFDPTGKDATHCWVTEAMTEREYDETFPDAARTSKFDSEVRAQGWMMDRKVRVAEYWQMEERPRTIAMMQNQSIQDVTDWDDEKIAKFALIKPNGEPLMRETMFRYATMVVTNGQEELSDPFELKIPRLPIIRVMGREIWVGDKRVRFGLTRFARDPQRLKNFWRSVIAELLMGAPRANYMAQAAAIKGRENDWANTLVYNDSTPMPTAITSQNLGAYLNEAQMSAQDMKDVTGLHDASLGMQGNETSGIAIQRRQHEGDIATVGYHDNMNAAMQETGEVLNALIPVAYDTARTIRVMGEDDAVRMMRINDPNFAPSDMVKDNVDITSGRYDVMATTGPAYQSRRQEAASGMIEFARANPSVMQIAGDLIAKAQDWPMAEEFAERMAPPDSRSGEDMSPQERQEAAQAQQLQQQAMQMEMAKAQADLQEATASARKAEAEAAEAEAEAQIKHIELANIKKELAIEGATIASAAAGDIGASVNG